MALVVTGFAYSAASGVRRHRATPPRRAATPSQIDARASSCTSRAARPATASRAEGTDERPDPDRRRRRRRRLPGRHRPDAAAAHPARRSRRSRVSYTDEEIAALAAYVASLCPRPGRSRPPRSSTTRDADLALGGELFRTNCAQCHNFAGQGGALTHGKYAPNLDAASAPSTSTRPCSPARRTCRCSATTRCARGQAGHHQVRPTTSRPRRTPAAPSLGRVGPVTEGLVRLDRRPRRADRRCRLDRGQGFMSARTATTPSRPRREPATEPTHRSRAATAPPSRRHRPAGRQARRAPGRARCSCLGRGLTDRLLRRCYVADPARQARSTSRSSATTSASNFALGLTHGPRAVPHRRRRDPLGQEAHARRGDRRRAPRRSAPTRRPPTAAAAAFAQRHRGERLRQAPAHPPHAARRDGARAAPRGRPAARPRPAARARASRETIWAKGIRLVADVTHLPDPPRGHPGRRPRQGRARRTSTRSRRRRATSTPRAKAPVILVRMRARRDPRRSRARTGTYEGILSYSKICTHVGCPIGLYEQRTHHLLCPCHQSTFDLADSGKVDLRPGRPSPAPACDHRGRRGILGGTAGTSPSPSARASGSADELPSRRPGGATATFLDKRVSSNKFLKKNLAQGLSGPLVLHARRDRALQLHHPAADRHVPDAVLQAVA